MPKCGQKVPNFHLKMKNLTKTGPYLRTSAATCFGYSFGKFTSFETTYFMELLLLDILDATSGRLLTPL